MSISGATKKTGGLAGVIAGQSAICIYGLGNGLNYYGYSTEELMQDAEFEEITYLLQFEELPSAKELENYKEKIITQGALSENLENVLEAIPKEVYPMNLMQTAVAALGALEGENEDFSDQDGRIIRLLGILPSILCYWYHYVNFGKEIDFDPNQTSIAEYFLEKLKPEAPKEDFIEAMQCSLILYAEHESNASIFTARICASTKSDIFSAATAAIGALRGPLHEEANEAAMHLMESFKSAEGAIESVNKKLENKELLMGFGHCVYGLGGDPRNAFIKVWSKHLGDDDLLFRISKVIEALMKEKRPSLPPNADFYSASTYHFMGIPAEYLTPIFITSRVSGWCAHIKEQRANNKLIRPNSEYIGVEPRKFVRIQDR